MSDWAATLLVGGRSSRMGEDKAFLKHPKSGQVLWQEMLELLQKLGPAEIVISANAKQTFPSLDIPVIVDQQDDNGPLGGIVASMGATTSEHLLALPVDMTAMEITVLERLIRARGPNLGAVFRDSGFYQSLPIVFPRSTSEFLGQSLKEGHRKLQLLIDDLQRQGHMRVLPVARDFQHAFANLNTPEDYAAFAAKAQT